MGARKAHSITVSLPPNMLDELDSVRKREGRTRSELLREALRRYIAVSKRSHLIPLDAPLPEEIEAMHRAEEEYARGACVRLEDLQHELGLRTR